MKKQQTILLPKAIIDEKHEDQRAKFVNNLIKVSGNQTIKVSEYFEQRLIRAYEYNQTSVKPGEITPVSPR